MRVGRGGSRIAPLCSKGFKDLIYILDLREEQGSVYVVVLDFKPQKCSKLSYICHLKHLG